MHWNDRTARHALLQVFNAAVAAADPRVVLAAHLPEKPKSGRCVVIGAGKSAASMAAALEAAWPDVALSGLVVTRYDHAVPTTHIQVMQSSHPVPDANSEIAARRMRSTRALALRRVRSSAGSTPTTCTTQVRWPPWPSSSPRIPRSTSCMATRS